jgi:hypothetical protein
MSRQANRALSKRRKKWNKRITLAKACKALTLTHVKRYNGLLWMDFQDLIDFLQIKKHKNIGKRNNFTMHEITNQSRHLLSQDFVDQEFIDKTVSRGYRGGACQRRYRCIVFSINDMAALEKYIMDCESKKEDVI